MKDKKLNSNELNQVIGGHIEVEKINKQIEDYNNELKIIEKTITELRDAVTEKTKRKGDCKQKILVLETLLETEKR